MPQTADLLTVSVNRSRWWHYATAGSSLTLCGYVWRMQVRPQLYAGSNRKPTCPRCKRAFGKVSQ